MFYIYYSTASVKYGSTCSEMPSLCGTINREKLETLCWTTCPDPRPHKRWSKKHGVIVVLNYIITILVPYLFAIVLISTDGECVLIFIFSL